MKLIVLMILLSSVLMSAQSVLVVNSNPKTKKYADAVEEFSHNFHGEFSVLDISEKSGIQIREALYDLYPDIVYAVGANAYRYANEYLPEKPIYFSSIADWNTLPAATNRFGVSDELLPAVQMTLLKSIFPDLKTIGVVHSRFTRQTLNTLARESSALGIDIQRAELDGSDQMKSDIDDMIQKSDIILLIPDPLFLSDEGNVKELFRTADRHKKPVVAYHELFIPYGAALMISSDSPTIGRQIASMIENPQTDETASMVQHPAGTRIILNKPQAVSIDMRFDPILWSFLDETVE